MKIKELSQVEKEAMSGWKPKIFDNLNFWHRPMDYPKFAGNIFYKSKKYNDYRIEYWNLVRISIELVPYNYDAWLQFIATEDVEKWCYLRDLVDIIDNDDFVIGNLYIINHI